MDDKHKVLMCVHAKAGSSSWKMIMANNTSKKPVNEAETGHIMIHNNMKRFGLHTLGHRSYSEEDIKMRLVKYYKFLVVRHPYDR